MLTEQMKREIDRIDSELRHNGAQNPGASTLFRDDSSSFSVTMFTVADEVMRQHRSLTRNDILAYLNGQ